jgi:hypothetical protein
LVKMIVALLNIFRRPIASNLFLLLLRSLLS